MSAALDVSALRRAGEELIAGGLNACQMAVGRDGEVVWFETFGEADDETRFNVASATKPIVASAVWLLIGDGLLDISRPVADFVPEFAANGKGAVTVEQVLLMTAGFPNAAMDPVVGADPAGRVAAMAEWTLEWEPGTRFAYHGSSAHWVLAELLHRLGGMDFRDFVEQRVTTPLGLPRVLGIRRDQQQNIAPMVGVAGSSIPAGTTIFPTTGGHDWSTVMECGIPSGGGVMTAATLVRFYQALLHNPGGLWKPDVLADATSNVRCTLPDPTFEQPANRTIGLVVGDGFSSFWGSLPRAFGHPGMQGQMAYADPDTGISFAFVQNGLDDDPIAPYGRAGTVTALAAQLGK